MAKTISLVVALSLAVLGPVLASWGSPREAFVPDRVVPAVESMGVRAPLQRREDKVAGSLARVPAVLRPAPSLEPQARPVLGSRAAVPRPLLRPFHATGPLVVRLSDVAFGPQVRPADLLVPDPPRRLEGAGDLLCIAVAIYHEARDQPLDGQLAVASVILNRMQEPERWGSAACEVVVPGQFSFLGADGSYPPVNDRPAWEIALEMAREALERGPSSLVGQADHYHTRFVSPDWNRDMRQVIRIDDHVFFLDPATRG